MACPVVLTSLRYYLPGFKFGGPVRSVSNMVEALGSEFEFRIVTSDRDLFDAEPYPGIPTNEWTRIGKAWVRYLSPSNRTLANWVTLLRQTPHDLLYLNSLFDPAFTIQPLLARPLSGTSRRAVLLAPRGELSPGAVSLKWWKKKPFLAVAKSVGLYRRVIWHASTADEERLIQHQFGDSSTVFIARNLASQVSAVPRREPRELPDEPFRIVFLSRISPKKNLDFALRVVAGVRVNAAFDIWGTTEDSSYWQECEKLVASMPENITVRYRGVAEHAKVVDILGTYDLFILPSLGENYGHAVAESLTAGTPLLLSDRTPWRNLVAHGVGWDLPLEAGEATFSRIIETAAERTKEDRKGWRQRVRKYATEHVYSGEALDGNRRLFRQAIGTTLHTT